MIHFDPNITLGDICSAVAIFITGILAVWLAFVQHRKNILLLLREKYFVLKVDLNNNDFEVVNITDIPAHDFQIKLYYTYPKKNSIYTAKNFQLKDENERQAGAFAALVKEDPYAMKRSLVIENLTKCKNNIKDKIEGKTYLCFAMRAINLVGTTVRYYTFYELIGKNKFSLKKFSPYQAIYHEIESSIIKSWPMNNRIYKIIKNKNSVKLKY